MTRNMNTMPTYRKGRTKFTPGPRDNRGISGFCSVLFLLLLLLAPPILLMYTETARYGRYMALSHAMDSDILDLNHSPSIHNTAASRPLAHGTSHDISTLATDAQAGISLPGALKLKRRAQYCQWSEHSSQQCQKCTRSVTAKDGSSKTETYDCNCITSYDYVKTWRDHRINSLLFNQPGAHYNPQRDPMPTTTLLGDATVSLPNHDKETNVRLDPSMLTNVRNVPFRRVDFVPSGRAPSPSFFERLSARLFGPRNTRYESLALLRDTQSAPAAVEHNFVYVGQGGYFFSPYENPSVSSRLFNWFIQYMEGSLFDWQIGDLMPSCTAGDLRFWYEVQDPASVSFLGEIHGGANGMLEMSPRELVINGNRERIGFVHGGSHSAEDMMAAEDTASRNNALIFRALLPLWSIPATRLVGVGLGREIGDSLVSTQIMGTVGVMATLLSSIWLVVWGNEVGSRDTIILFVMGGYFTVLALRSSVKRSRGRWYNAVWCRVGRWANVPPEWRVEDSYIPAPVSGPESKRL